MAAGTISVTPLFSPSAQSEDIQQYVINWTTTSGGAANGVLMQSDGVTPIVFKGTQLQVAYKPGSATTGAASLKNAVGTELLTTIFATLTAAIQDTPLSPSGIPFILGGTTLSLSVTGGGNALTGSLYVWTR